MLSQPVLTIFSGSIIVLWIGLRLLKKSGQTFSRRTLGYILLGGIALTALSIINHVNTYAGSNHLTRFGWPHDFITKKLPSAGNADWVWSINWGPLGSYVWTNIVFYFSLIVFVIGGLKYFRRAKNKNTAG